MTLHHHHPPPTENSMSAISQLLLARFWPNFKGRFLGHSRTDSNCYGDICAGNIYPGNICPYQEYLNCYWPDFNQMLEVGWQGQGKVKARSGQGQDKVRAGSGQGQGKVRARSGQGQCKVRARSSVFLIWGVHDSFDFPRRGKANEKLLESKNYLAKVVHSTHITNGKWSCFLAATSSSRSDDVTLFACLLVCLFVTLFL